MSAPVERMKKILALARRGVGGEKTTAEAMLARLMTKYGMTLADLENEAQPVARREFKYASEFDRKLLVQIVASVMGTAHFDVWRRRGRKALLFDLTALQFAEVDVRLAAYRPVLRRELVKATQRVFSAFVHANNLVNYDSGSADDAPVDMDEIEAIVALMRTMKPTPIHQQIEHEATAG